MRNGQQIKEKEVKEEVVRLIEQDKNDNYLSILIILFMTQYYYIGNLSVEFRIFIIGMYSD